jgi:hypothetical protein
MLTRRLLSLFLLVISVPCFAQVTFTFDQVSAEGLTAIGDFNLDGYPDLAIFQSGVLHVYLGVGNGNFNLAFVNSTVPTATLEMYTADMNNDGILDMVLLDGQTGKVFFFYGDGTGNFPSSSSVTFNNPAFTVRIGDLNRDGKVDLVASGCPDGGGTCTTEVKLNHGHGSFITSQVLPFIGSSLLLSDVSHDGQLDLVYPGTGPAQMAIRKGNGNGTFQAPSNFSLPATCPPDGCGITEFATADFDNDGRLDIAILFGNSVYIYRKNEGAGFTLAHTTTFPDSYTTMAVADLNGDQKQDLVLSNFRNVASFALGNGKGGFGAAQSLPSSFAETTFLYTRDLALTSRQDIVGSAGVLEPIPATPIAMNATPFTACIPPNASKLAAKICSPTNASTVASQSVKVQASGNSPAGVLRLEIWIDGVKKTQRWADQIAQPFTLSPGTHHIAVVAIDKYSGVASKVSTINVP